MKFEYFEGVHGMEINMVPETPKEVAQLLRISKNANAEKPDIRFYFDSDTPNCHIWIKKRKESVQVHSINPNTK